MGMPPGNLQAGAARPLGQPNLGSGAGIGSFGSRTGSTGGNNPAAQAAAAAAAAANFPFGGAGGAGAGYSQAHSHQQNANLDLSDFPALGSGNSHQGQGESEWCSLQAYIRPTRTSFGHSSTC